MSATADRIVKAWDRQVDTRVRIAGSGPPLVYLHGAGGLRWDRFLDELASEHTVYAPEHPGTSPGGPDAIKPIDTLWDLVLYYYELFDALGLEQPALVGHSFGGMVAAELAATDPNRVSKLVLICPIGLWRDDAPVVNWMIMPQEELWKLVYYDPEGPVAKELTTPPQDEAERIEAEIASTWALACSGKFIWPIPDKGLKKRIHRITAPTLVVWGEADKLVPPVYAEEFASRLGNARVEMVPAAAHVPQLEQLDAVSARVRDFLRE